MFGTSDPVSMGRQLFEPHHLDVTAPDLPRPLPVAFGGAGRAAVAAGAAAFEDDGSGE